MNDYILEVNEELTKVFGDTMEGLFVHELYKKSFSNQLESDKTDTLQQRIERWMMVVYRRDPTPKVVFDYSFAEMYNLYGKAVDREMRELVKAFRDRLKIP